jgi:hypothetical protein
MDDEKRSDDRPQAGAPRPVAETTNWGRQIIGAAIGALLVLVLGTAAKLLGWTDVDLARYVWWGAVVGGLFGSSESLERAGGRLTRRPEAWLNISVSLVGMAVIFAVLFGLTRAMLALMAKFD